MYPYQFFNFKVKIKEKIYITATGVQYPQTACISFYNQYGKEIFYVELAYISVDVIYNKILSGDNCDFNNLYIENFDVLKCAKNNKQSVVLKNFSAKQSLFYADIATNFNNSIFSESPACFEGALFLKGSVLFQNCIFEEGFANFNSVNFHSGDVSFSNSNFVKGDANFKNCFFGDGNKDFQYVNWGNSDVLFSNTAFNNGNLSFVNNFFGDGEISFKICNFGNGIKDFKFSNFGNTNINFERSKIGDGVLDFSKSEFGSCKINFNKSKIGRTDVNFDEIEMSSGKLLFKNIYIEEGLLSFDESKISDVSVFLDKSIFKEVRISFYKTSVGVLSFNACHINSYADLRLNYCQYLDLSDAFINDDVDLSLEENPQAIKALNLFGCRITGRLFLSWTRNLVYKQIVSNENSNAYKNAWQYNLLKRNFNQIGQYSDEDKSYVAFKREELKIEKGKIKKSAWYIKPSLWLIYCFKKLIFDKMGLYATSPFRVFISVVIVWALFGLIFSLLHFLDIGKTWSSVGNPDKMSIVAQSFYHSAITFFTIGYGDVYPQGLSRIFSSIEGFIGVFMMSYFTVAFVRKVLR